MKILSEVTKKLTSFYNSVVCKLEKTSQKDLLKGNKPLSWWRKIKLFFIMRELSDFEKNIIKRLVDWEETVEGNPGNVDCISTSILLCDLAREHYASYEIKDNFTKIILESTTYKQKENLENNNNYRRKFISIIYFLEYLKSERLIYFVPYENTINNDFLNVSHKIPQREAFRTEINDKEFILLIKSLFGKGITPTEYLIKYCNKNYKTDEEVRFEVSMTKSETAIKYTRLSMFFAIGIGLVSIITSIITCVRPNQNLINVDNKLTTVIEKMDSSTIILKENLVKLNSKNKKKNNNLHTTCTINKKGFSI